MNSNIQFILNKMPFLRAAATHSVKSINRIINKKKVLKTLQMDSLPDIYKNKIIQYNQNRPFGYNVNLCQAPFSSLYFKTNGDVVACCKNNVDIYGNIKDTSLADIWNSSKKYALQEKIVHCNLDKGCEFCKKELLAENFTAVHARIHDVPFPKRSYDFPLDITFEISNVCNLECVMCGGDFSSLIRKNKEKLPPLSKHYPADFLDQLKPFLKNVKTARFQGGEPFLIKDYLEIIEYLNRHNPSCNIYVQTNGTILNNRVRNILRNSRIHLSISMDSLKKDRAEYIRKNLNFDSFLNNLNEFSRLSKKNSYTININFCLMNNNWDEIPDLFHFCIRNNTSLNIIPVYYPSILSLSHLKHHDISGIESYLKENIPANKTNALSLEYKSLLNHISSLKSDSIIRDKEIEELSNMPSDALYSTIEEHLRKYLSETSVGHILQIYKKTLFGFNTKDVKKILAITVINNRILDESDRSMEYYEHRFTQKLIEYFEYEVNNFTNPT